MKQYLITGVPRSGTTLIGNIVGSCENVEYFFEPPLITLLINLESIDDESFMRIFEHYRDNDLMNQALAGRNLNFNAHDDTYVYKLKNEEEIRARLSKSWRTNELQAIARNKIFAFKIPGYGNWVNKLFTDESFRLILVLRNIDSVINSLIKKGWFENNPNSVLPYTNKIGSAYCPNLIPHEWQMQWRNLSVFDRCSVYINVQLKIMLNCKKPKCIIDYDEIIRTGPKYITQKLEQIGLTTTLKSKELYDSLVFPKNSTAVNKSNFPIYLESLELYEGLLKQ